MGRKGSPVLQKKGASPYKPIIKAIRGKVFEILLLRGGIDPAIRKVFRKEGERRKKNIARPKTSV